MSSLLAYPATSFSLEIPMKNVLKIADVNHLELFYHRLATALPDIDLG